MYDKSEVPTLLEASDILGGHSVELVSIRRNMTWIYCHKRRSNLPGRMLFRKLNPKS